MPRIVKCGLIQAANALDPEQPVEKVREAMTAKHLPLIDEAGRQGVQILCLQELFNGPYFPPSQDARWYELAEPVPDGPSTKLLQEYALKAYKAIDCAGMARVDFLVDKESSEIYLNEVNTIPGFTPISMYPKLWEASGLEYAELIDELIRLALERKTEKDQLVRKYDRKD